MSKVFSFYFPSTKEKLLSPIEILTPKKKKIVLPKLRYLGFKLPKNIDNKFLRKIGEDSMKIRKIKDFYIFALADGIGWRGSGKENFPTPSPAKKAADIFTSLIYKIKPFDDLEYFLRFYFSLANKKIFEFNLKRLKNEKINFWNVDYAHISALLALIKGNKIFYGLIGENSVLVINKKGKIKHQSKKIDWFYKNYPFKDFIKKLDSLRKKEFRNYYDMERLGRKYFRNKLDANYIPYGYGVLTGEKDALIYVIYDKVDLEKEDIVLLFTDGFLSYLDEPEFKKIILSKDKNLIEKFLEEKRNINPIKFGSEFSLFIYYHF
jgi:serine/threonine protein phosphatase PrpC